MPGVGDGDVVEDLGREDLEQPVVVGRVDQEPAREQVLLIDEDRAYWTDHYVDTSHPINDISMQVDGPAAAAVIHFDNYLWRAACNAGRTH